MKRRTFVRTAGAAALAAPFYRLLRGRAEAAHGDGVARRLIVFYFPDGVAGPAQDGSPSLWHPTGSETGFALPPQVAPLAPHRDACVFFTGLSMGPTDSGSHPGGAKKLLTAVDGGNGISIDQHLAATVGADRPFRHVYLGVQANVNGASGDKHISYVAPGTSTPPEDDPTRAFARLFGQPVPPSDGGGDAEPDPRTARRLSVLDASLADLQSLRAKLGGVDRAKLDLHLEALREVETRLGGGAGGGGGGGGPTCDEPYLDVDVSGDALYAPESFPALLRAQTDVMVQAMACDLTRVGVIQGSHHTSELIMSRFEGTEMHDPSFDMRSHQASHYGASHDFARPEFAHFFAQRVWWMQQLAYLLDQLAQRPEGDGNMLDYSLVLVANEVSDGNTHSHDDMPFLLCGGGGGAIRTGRLHAAGYHRHADLLVAVARAMGSDLTSFGQASAGPLPGLLV